VSPAPRLSASTRADLIAIGILAGVLSLAYLPLFGGAILFFRDDAYWTYPARWFIRQAFERGDVSDWNPDQGLGFSVFSNPLYGLYYPPHLLFLLGPLERMVTWFHFLHLCWGGAGVALLARRLGASVAAAVIAGVAWSLAGFTTSMWNAGVLLSAGAWVPWCGVGFLRLARDAHVGGSAWLGAVAAAAAPVAMGLLLGEVFMAILGAGFGAAVAVILWWGGGDRNGEPSPLPGTRTRWSRRLSAAALALAFAAACGAISVMPAGRAAGGTDRARPLDRTTAELYSVHPLRLLELAAPGAMGNPYGVYPGARWVGEPELDSRPLGYGFYLGSSVIALALLAAGRGRRLATAFGILALAALLVCLGRYAPVHQALRTIVRPLAYMRYPEKYGVILVGAAAVLAGLGAARLLTPGEPPRWRRTAVLLAVLSAIAAAARALFPHDLAPFVRTGMAHGAIAVAVVLAVQVLSTRRPKAAPALLVACVAGDLAVASWPLQEFISADVARRAPVAAQAIVADHAARHFRVRPRVYRANSISDVVRRLDVTGSRALEVVPLVHTLISNTVTTFGVAAVPGYDAAIPSALGDLWETKGKPGSSVLRLFAVDYALLPVADPSARPDRRVGFEPMMDPIPGARLYRVQDALPRVYLAGQAAVLDDARAQQAVFEPDVLAGGRVILAPSPQALGLEGGAPSRAGACAVRSFHNARIEARCRADRDGVVVFVEQYAEGWTATIDGVAAPLLRANLVCRAVGISAGEHDVILTYQPPGVAAARVISLLGALALGGCGVAAWTVGRARRARHP